MMDSTDISQEPTDAAVDSVVDGQELGASTVDDNSATRINGLMRLVGLRTTEAGQQKARAEQAEAELAAARDRLQAYESGTYMSATEAQEQESLIQPAGADTEDNITSDDTDDFIPADDDEREQRAEAMRAAWPNSLGRDDVPQDEGVDWSDVMAGQIVDPNSASRASSLRATNPTETERIRSEFERRLDGALEHWGVEVR